MKFDAIFSNRIQYTSSIHAEVKDWVAESISEWTMEGADWFKIELMHDEFLPAHVLQAAGGVNRERRSSAITTTRRVNNNNDKVHPAP